MARAPDPFDGFACFLAQSEHSTLTLKNYWRTSTPALSSFQCVSGETMEPAKVTPMDLRQSAHRCRTS
jgi:hypothetical protein